MLGVRREDKNKWERRAPLAPEHVKTLVGQGIKVIVQPSARRVFSDDEYREAGAVVQEDLAECSTIAAVKEVPVDLLLPGRTYIFFSHTIKAQAAGMPLLDAALERKVRLIDYECITSTGMRGGPRLVAFGGFAGYAGAIDFLRGIGERFLALGFSTPLLNIGSAFMYQSLDEAMRAVRIAGEAIAKNGLPSALCPFNVVFTGKGNVTQGALAIFKLLPHDMVDPGDLRKLPEAGHGSKEDCHKVFLSIATAEHMVKHRHGGPFDKDQYYAQPDQYESIFQDTLLPYSTVIVNGMYWDARFPRLFDHEDLHRHVVSGHDRLLGVCDITCDADGSVPTRQFTSIEQPFFVFNALTEQTHTSLDEPGVLFHAVDHLPSELPREASQHFGNCLLEFIPAMVAARAPQAPGQGDTQALPPPIRGAVICEGGALTRDYEYIQQLRVMNHASDDFESEPQDVLRPHGLHAPAASVTLELTGHLFDTKLINKICDLVEVARGRVEINKIDIGGTVTDDTFMSMLVSAHDKETLDMIVTKIRTAASESKVQVRRADGSAITAALPGQALKQVPSRNVLVLGAGFVSGPLIEYLLRRPENMLTIASLHPHELESFVERYGARVCGRVLDITSEAPDALAAQEALVKETDLVVSLIPATFHVPVARLAVKHRKHMVTASYVSDEMQALDEEARKAGVLIINEVGLDPGIDHMSAMQMIDDATADGKGRVVRFSSLCGGLPAPEAAGSNPLGYKFSWSPKGVLLAARNAARWQQDGKIQEVAGPDLLGHTRPFMLNNAFAFDVLPNRDSTVFAELYGLTEAPTFFRGTLRYHGFCERMLALARLGLLEPGPVAALRHVAAEAPTRRGWLAALLGVSGAPGKLYAAVREKLGGDGACEVGLDFLTWLGFLSEEPLPAGVPADSPIDVITKLLDRPEMSYQTGERDMVAMYHELLVERRDGGLERRTATLVEYAQPQGATAMARTVGLTAAICAQLVLDDAAAFGAGVQRPLSKVWYEPVLRRLGAEGIRLEERVEQVQTPAPAAAGSSAAASAGAAVFASKL